MHKPMIDKILDTLVIEARIYAGSIPPSNVSAMSPNKKTKDGSPSPQRAALVKPTMR